MTEFQPTPQTPEQVADGLRDAMKQAKEDGVFDNPYFSNGPVKHLCTWDVLGGGQFYFHFTKRHLIPNRWVRFWTRVFLNSKWNFENE